MRYLAPALLALSACAAPAQDLGPLQEELHALRQEVQELRKLQPPGIESVAALDDLAHEVKRLREKTAPAPAAPPAPVRENPILTPLPTGSLVGGVGGTQPNVNDLYWILTRVAVDGEERTVLALYRAGQGSAGFKLAGVRWVGPDLQMVEYAQEKPRVKDVVDELKKLKK